MIVVSSSVIVLNYLAKELGYYEMNSGIKYSIIRYIKILFSIVLGGINVYINIYSNRFTKKGFIITLLSIGSLLISIFILIILSMNDLGLLDEVSKKMGINGSLLGLIGIILPLNILFNILGV
jgi:hypothetical protein